jgi:hypothetical protein
LLRLTASTTSERLGYSALPKCRLRLLLCLHYEASACRPRQYSGSSRHTHNQLVLQGLDLRLVLCLFHPILLLRVGNNLLEVLDPLIPPEEPFFSLVDLLFERCILLDQLEGVSSLSRTLRTACASSPASEQH